MLKSINRTIMFLTAGLILALGLYVGHAREILIIPPTVWNFLGHILFILTIFLLASIVIRLTTPKVAEISGRAVTDEHRLLLRKFYAVGIFLIAIFLSLWKVGVSLTDITLVIGLMATGVAFAIRDVLVLIFGWFILLTKQPFKIGDNIRIGSHEGLVKHIGTHYVHIDATPYSPGEYVKVPNRIFLEQPIENYGKQYVPCNIQLPLKNVQGWNSVEKRLRAIAGENAIIHLESSNAKVLASITFFANPENRPEIKSQIVETLGKRLQL